MPRIRGHWVSVSRCRQLIIEMMRACRDMPIITIERRMQLADLAAAREALEHPPSWVTLFAKAFARVAEHRPELRRTYMPWPWSHFYETEESVASIAIERDYQGESCVFFGQFRSPNLQSVAKLQEAVAEWRNLSVEEVRDFRRSLKIMRVPRPFRDLAWWYATKVAGRHHTRQFGTFGISTTASAGATCQNLIAPVTTTLNYGLFHEDGSIEVRLHFDHRVYDGMPAARTLAEMEEVLRTEILAELRESHTNRLGPTATIRNVDVIYSEG
jgi:hypothetical protein